MISLTLDNIFDDYHNHKIPISCNKQGVNGITKNYYDYYESYEPYLHFYRRKVKKNALDNLKVKHYIKIGDNCPICFDEINHRKNAFLTDCGHSFHYSCIMKYEYSTYFTTNGIMCPVCRQDMGNYSDMKDLYPYSKNEFDKLSDFENNLKTKIPKMCFDFLNFRFNNHFHLTQFNSCMYCRLY